MKTIILLLLFVHLCNSALGQKSNFSYNFYGFIRGDLFYNTRQSVAPVDGNFYLYPLDKKTDKNGQDLHKITSGTLYTFTSRIGLNIKGPKVGNAETTANIETDFGGVGKKVALLRLRQAYFTFNWPKHQLLVGQTWHPLFGNVCPDILNLSTGAPFQPFNRSPQIRYTYKSKNIHITASALWQLQYTSHGPSGASADYLKNSCTPEFYLGGDWYPSKDWQLGIGAHLLSITPRCQSEWKNKIYKVNERLTTTSYEIHTKYRFRKFNLAAKSLWASALDHSALLGGYGISRIDPTNGEQEYTAFHHSTTWLNLTYGYKWKPTIFIGYTKNLGTTKSLIDNQPVYGSGLDIDQLLNTQIGFSYNLPHWQVGLEGSICSAWYGDINNHNGKVAHTHRVTNYRILGLVMYHF